MRGQTSFSRPIISQIICTGTCAAMSSTNSTSPFSHTSSTIDGSPPLDLVDQLADHPRREALRHQPAVPLVLGRVHVEDRQPQRGEGHLVGGGDERGAELGGEGAPVVADRLDVGVLGHGPEPGVVDLRVPEHRRLPAQPVELVVRHLVPHVVASRSMPSLIGGRSCRAASSGVPVTTPRSAATAMLVGDRIGIDAAHHLQAQQQSDHGAGPTDGRVGPSTPCPPPAHAAR